MFTRTPVYLSFQLSHFVFSCSLSAETHDSVSEIFYLASSSTFKILVSHQVSDELSDFSSRNIQVDPWYDGGSANKKFSVENSMYVW